MSQQPYGTGLDRLSQLPTELLIAIFQQCADFSSVWSLMRTSRLMLSVFNYDACGIVSSVMRLTVPVQTRILMQAILAMHMGTFQCKRYGEVNYFLRSDIRPADEIIASTTQLRKFVRLSHYIHVLAHLYIKRKIWRCLENSSGQPQSGSEIPTWTEERLVVLAFWRLIFWNQLKIEGLKGSLGWSTGDLKQLASSNVHDHYPSITFYSCLAASNFIAKISPAEGSFKSSQWLPRHPFKLPSIPSERECSWVCKPPPSSRAITQGRTFERCERSLEVMFPLPPGPTLECIQSARYDKSRDWWYAVIL